MRIVCLGRQLLLVGGLLGAVGCQIGSGWLFGSDPEEPVTGPEGRPALQTVFNCDSTEEFLTTITYLRHQKDLGLAEQDMRSVATAVSGGCHGAAGRFVMITELLLKAGVDGRSALVIGEEYALESAAQAEAFRDIFRHSYVSTGLDLQPPAAIALAQRLLKSVPQAPESLADEFDDLVDFCVGQKGLDLSRPDCANLVAAVLINAPLLNTKESPGIAESFVDSYMFLTDQDGPNLTTRDGLAMAQRLAAISPFAPTHFEKAYEFAIAPKGLGLDRSQGVGFAMELAEKTVGQMSALPPPE